MRIKCPWCGDRPREEFSYLGDATVRRPEGEAREDPKAWQDYVYLRDNPAGRHREHWQHTGGCRSVLVVERITSSHAIEDVAFADPARGGKR